ncbi:MAG: SHOCT domain-containing protein [Planctomycetales bacterium]|nr:SHOCT domain-containing protein [Planctomycetales bacterium]NIP71249.1 SHOCT domain-containing protein [Planctomycetales bacterium]
MGGGMMNGFGGFGSFGLIGGILNLVITIGLIVGVVLLIVWLVRRVGPSSGQTSWPLQQTGSPASPREILQTRFARGEITREQYQQMLTDLS